VAIGHPAAGADQRLDRVGKVLEGVVAGRGGEPCSSAISPRAVSITSSTARTWVATS
jgi:hypothetical protein